MKGGSGICIIVYFSHAFPQHATSCFIMAPCSHKSSNHCVKGDLRDFVKINTSAENADNDLETVNRDL